jgi:hypothetical protein
MKSEGGHSNDSGQRNDTGKKKIGIHNQHMFTFTLGFDSWSLSGRWTLPFSFNSEAVPFLLRKRVAMGSETDRPAAMLTRNV